MPIQNTSLVLSCESHPKCKLKATDNCIKRTLRKVNNPCTRRYKHRCLIPGGSSTSPSLMFLSLKLDIMSGPGVSVCNSSHDAITWRAENRTHLSKQTRPSTEHSRKASNVRGIPARPDDQLRWILIVRSQVYILMGGEIPYS